MPLTKPPAAVDPAYLILTCASLEAAPREIGDHEFSRSLMPPCLKQLLFYDLPLLERSLIAERVRAGLRNACAKGKRLRRPRKVVDTHKIMTLRSQGASWPQIAAQLGASVGKVYAAGRAAGVVAVSG